ncbi:T9SS type A sorting domain-containing protein [Neolewinella agarilytica]|uniref:Por secretion system C-terminal sorting domain-containing protein n=1 Tax=Neolewinella agarilytica TaxID=478744 RepID=A0A1H9HV22_9BACT|nr:T9SS type A sorting domain-containing protein [Neolewinella agarilytica]SEQ66170.1 Por secretion system C-terminal sorting domain-containing protein [Neolewinella agarilytica]
MNFISLKAILLVQIIFFLGSSNPLSAQRFTIPDLVVGENDSFVDVPVYIDWPDSSVSMQLSILWDSAYLKFDTITFSPTLLEAGSTLYNVIRERQLRVLMTPSLGGINIIQAEKDSLAFFITFRIIKELPGGTEIWFNPNFPNVTTTYSLNETDAVVTSGSVTYPGRSVSSQNARVKASGVRVFPNPASYRIWVTGLPFGEISPPVQLYDQLGRVFWSGELLNGEMRLPDSIPNGFYWLSIHAGRQSIVKPIMVRR